MDIYLMRVVGISVKVDRGWHLIFISVALTCSFFCFSGLWIASINIKAPGQTALPLLEEFYTVTLCMLNGPESTFVYLPHSQHGLIKDI